MLRRKRKWLMRLVMDWWFWIGKLDCYLISPSARPDHFWIGNWGWLFDLAISLSWLLFFPAVRQGHVLLHLLQSDSHSGEALHRPHPRQPHTPLNYCQCCDKSFCWNSAFHGNFLPKQFFCPLSPRLKSANKKMYFPVFIRKISSDWQKFTVTI